MAILVGGVEIVKVSRISKKLLNNSQVGYFYGKLVTYLYHVSHLKKGYPLV
jgi:hypothetical protein